MKKLFKFILVSLIFCLSFGIISVQKIQSNAVAAAQSVIDLEGTDLNGAVILDDTNKYIPSQSYICPDNNGYNISSAEQNFMFKKDDKNVPYLNFFVDTVNGGKVLKGQDYNGYNSYGYIVGEGDPIYDINKETGEPEKNEDGEDKLIGYKYVDIKLNYNFNSRQNILGSDGKLWSISDDSWQKGVCGFPVLGVVGQGALVVQKFVPSQDKEYPTSESDWNILNQFNLQETFGYHTVDFFNKFSPEDNQTPISVYQPKGDDLKKGVYVKITVAYEVKTKDNQYMTLNDGKTNIKLPFSVTTYKNVVEQTTFYLCNTSAEVIFENFYFSSGETTKEEDKSETKLEQKGGAISNNQGSKDGFKLNLNGSNFDVKYKYNDSTNLMDCVDGQVFVNTGKYEFLITTKIGLKRTKIVYIHEKTNEKNLQVYFGDGLVSGGRVFAPTNAFPVYFKDGLTLATQNENIGTIKHAPLVGQVYRFDEDWGEVERGDDGLPKADLVAVKGRNDANWSVTNLKKGNYEAIFANNEEYFDGTATGDTYVFVWRFSVAETECEPFVNKQAFDNVLGISDYESLHYEVVLPTKGTGSLRVVFADYLSAYNFACRYYASTAKTSQNSFEFDNVIYQKESEMVAAIHAKAKLIVEKRYFDINDEKTFVTLKENIIAPVLGKNPTEQEKEDYNNFVNILNREFNCDVLVFSNQDDTSLNAVGLPFLNDREYAYLNENGQIERGKTKIYFVSISEYESNKVTLIHETSGKTFVVPYGVAVESFLELNKAPTGVYKIVEENYSSKTEYEAIYIRKGDITSTITLERTFNNTTTTHTLNKLDANVRLRANNVVIKDIENLLDDYGLIKIIKLGEYTHTYQIDEVESIPALDEEGNYEIVLADRLGNSVKYYIDIFTASKVYDFELVNGEEVVLKDYAYGGKSFKLPVLSSVSVDFEFGGWQDENGNIYTDEYVFNVPKNIKLTAVWNYKNIEITVFDGSKIATYNQKVGKLQALPKISKIGYVLYGYKYTQPDGTIKFYRGQINYVPNVAKMRLDAVWVKTDKTNIAPNENLTIHLINGELVQSIEGSKSGKIALPALQNTNKTIFAGWLYEYELSGYIFSDEMTYDEIASIGIKDENCIKLYAIWLSEENNNAGALAASSAGTGLAETIGTLASKSLPFISIILPLLIVAIVLGKRKKSTNKTKTDAALALETDNVATVKAEDTIKFANIKCSHKYKNPQRGKITWGKIFKKVITPCLLVFMSVAMLVMSQQNFLFAIKQSITINQAKEEFQAQYAQAQKLNEENQQEPPQHTYTYDILNNSIVEPTIDAQTTEEGNEEEDDVNYEKEFLTSLAIIDLISFGYDDVFPAYAKVGTNTADSSDDRLVKGYAYTNYAQAYEENNKIYFGAGFFSMMEDDHLTAKDIESGVELLRDTDEYEEDDEEGYNNFKLTQNRNWGPYHYIAYEKYVNYLVADYVLSYVSVPDSGVYNDTLGDVYNYDIGDYSHYANYNSEFSFDGYTINQDVDYQYLFESLKQVIGAQTAAGIEVNVDKIDFISYQALHDYVTGAQNETVLGLSSEQLLYYEANVPSTCYYVILADGTIEVLQLPTDPEDKATTWERIWMTVASFGAVVIGVVACAIPYVGPMIGGAIISGAVDAFMQVVIAGKAPKDIDWASIGVSMVTGMLTGAVGMGAKSITKAALKGVTTGLKKFFITAGVNVAAGLFSSAVTYFITTPKEQITFKDIARALLIGSVSGVVMTIGDQLLSGLANKSNVLQAIGDILNGAASGASVYLLSCLITGNEFNLKSFLVTVCTGAAISLVTIAGNKIVQKIQISREQRTLKRMYKASKISDADLQKRVKYLPGPKNKNWTICDEYGNPIDKKTLIENNGNGLIKGKNGIEIPIKDGCPVFDKFSHENVDVVGGFSTNREKNFDAFDNSLAEKWGKGGVPEKYQEWFDKNNIDTDLLSSKDIYKFRKANNLVWHEHENGITGQLLDSSLHTARYGGIPHVGGISIKKETEALKTKKLIDKYGEKNYV